MDSKKIFIWPVIISIIGHTALISVSSMIDLRQNVKAEQLFTVQLAQPQQAQAPEDTIKEKNPQPEKTSATSKSRPLPEGEREDTVDIGSDNVKYEAYLAGVKKKIMRIWKYPAAAYAKSEEGVVVVKISIDSSGALAQTTILNPSGFTNLDSGTLQAVRAAAPYLPLPRQYELTRLHIIASFNYRLRD